jgi:hypothetical protein
MHLTLKPTKLFFSTMGTRTRLGGVHTVTKDSVFERTLAVAIW